MKKPFNTHDTDRSHAAQPLADEQGLLEHYRQHSLAQPSLATDALILAAAAAQINRTKAPISSWRQRLHAWVFGPGHPLRWSLALGSLASIGLGLTLSLRTVDQLPPAYDLGEPLPTMSAAPAAPAALAAPAPLAEPVLEAMELKKSSTPSRSALLATPPSPVLAQDQASVYDQAESAAEAVQVLGELNANSRVAAKQQAANAPTASLADSAATADNHAERAKAKTAATLEQQLRALLQLQRSGATPAAAAELERLQRLYPAHDLAAELAKLRASEP